MAHIDETGILALLHNGQNEKPPWSAFLKDLQRALRADAASLLFCQGAPNAAQATSWQTADGARTELASLDGLRPNRVYAFVELTPAAEAEAPPFGRTIRVCDGEAWSAWLIVSREQSDFTAADSVLLSKLAPHLAIAMRAFSAMECQRQRADIAHDLLSRIGVTSYLVDKDGRLIEGGTPNTRKHVERALLHFATNGAATAANVPDKEGSPPVTLLSTTASHGSLAAAPAAHRVVVARTQQPLGANLVRHFEHLWSLSASEARLTVAVANGLSLVEAAEELGLTTETARNYSKRIYAKTGARGLPDLVRLALNSVAILG